MLDIWMLKKLKKTETYFKKNWLSKANQKHHLVITFNKCPWYPTREHQEFTNTDKYKDLQILINKRTFLSNFRVWLLQTQIRVCHVQSETGQACGGRLYSVLGYSSRSGRRHRWAQHGYSEELPLETRRSLQTQAGTNKRLSWKGECWDWINL